MGCTTSKGGGSPMMRMLEYERLAASENEGLKLLPNRHNNNNNNTFVYCTPCLWW